MGLAIHATETNHCQQSVLDKISYFLSNKNMMQVTHITGHFIDPVTMDNKSLVTTQVYRPWRV